MEPVPSLNRRSTAPVLALALLLLAGCGSGSDGAATTPSPTAESTPAATPTPTPTAEPEPTQEPLPQARVDAGTVGEGAPATATGEGPAQVGVKRSGEFGVVAHVDCSACTGDVEITADGRMSPWGAGPAPFSGTYLIDNIVGSAEQQVLVVRAQGPWTIRFESWNDLAPVSGVQQGTGSAVLLIGDDASAVQVDFTPAGPEDKLSARVISAVDVSETGSPATLLFGDSVAFSETAQIRMPGIVTVATNGSWTITPLP